MEYNKLNPHARYYVPATICHDLTEQQVNNGETPEVKIIEDRGIIFGKQSYNIQNIETGAVYRNISYQTLIVR